MATIIFDFDHTLLDTERLKTRVREIFINDGAPKEIIDNTKVTSFLEYTDLIKEKGFTISAKAMEEFFYEDLKPYLIGPVKETLENLKKDHHIIMLTKGEDYFQQWKLRQSSVGPIFGKDIYICEDHKELMLQDIHFHYPAYFINDHIDEISKIKKIFPKMKCILVKRKDRTYSDAHKKMISKEIEDISALLKIVK